MRPCLVLSHALHCRNWIASGMLDKMTDAGLCGTVLMPAALIIKYSPQIPWDHYALEPWMAGRWSARVLEALRLGMLVAGARRGGLNYRMKVQAKRRPAAAAEMLAWRLLSRLADPLPIVRGLARALPSRAPDWRFKGWSFPPSCTHLLLPTMIHEDSMQAGIVKAARRAGLPVWAVPASWDNLVTKGRFLDQPDRIAVWGTASCRHAIEQHGFAPGQVTVTGPPHFWPYSPAARIAKLVMPHGRRYVLFAGTTVNYAADELLIIRSLADALTANIETQDLVILYRPHPRRTFTPSQRDALDNHHHIVMDPRWRGGWSGDPADIPWIRTITEGAICTISAFSTVVLESALVGTPSILIGFGDSAHGTGQALDHTNYEHMIQVIAQPGVYVVSDLRTLLDQVQACAQGVRPKPDELRRWALSIAAVDADPRDRLIEWLKEGA